MNTPAPIRKGLSGMVGISGKFRTTGVILRRQLWLWPIIAAVILAVVGWFANGILEDAMGKQVAGGLSSILAAEVQAVGIWIKEQETDAELLAEAGPVAAAAREMLKLADATPDALLKAEAQARMRAYLQPRLTAYDYSDYLVITRSLRIVASDEDSVLGKTMDGYRAEFCKRVLGGRAAVSKPFASVFVLPNEKGERVPGLPTIYTAAPIRDGNNKPIGVFAVRIPEGRFNKILQVAQPGQSCETFAFDKQGLFLSSSRFDDALKRIGLLADVPGARSTLTLEVRDPQANLMAGERPAKNRAEQPLTRMAQDAIAGGKGVDVHGQRDYRGVHVITAWEWLPEFDFGVATQIDVDEAYQGLYILRTIFWALFVLLGLSAVGILVFMFVAARQRQRAEHAEHTVSQLGQYTLQEKIGAGGMGSVYRAKHAFLKRPTAIKMLNLDTVDNASVSRFEREVQLTSQLSHPNTIAVFDYGRTPEGVLYYAMEYLDGVNLEDLVKAFGPLPDGRVIGILKQICGSLSEAHVIGLIHRDVKPANIILTCRAGIADFVKVLDFGLVKVIDADQQARLTQANVTVGTPYYVSPEAIERPDTVTAQSDIYAIGAVGYYLLTGSPVFTGKTVMEICMKHVKVPPDLPSKRLGQPIAASLEAIILQCLAKDPNQRPATARALMTELSRCEPLQPWTDADAMAWWSANMKPSPALAETTPIVLGQPTPHG